VPRASDPVSSSPRTLGSARASARIAERTRLCKGVGYWMAATVFIAIPSSVARPDLAASCAGLP
jgi:hypothetical protein